jgi:uncharacterized protein YbaR (Trm112 family)
MPVSKDLLEILCCPKTKVPVQELGDDKRSALNKLIEAGSVTFMDGSIVETPLEEGLITEDGKTIYRVDDSIPIMLIDKGIPVQDLDI